MRFRVLGCFGGSAPDMRPTSFLLNESIAIDAGALTSSLSLAEQQAISHVFLSHSHVDHLGTLPFLLDNVFTSLREPLQVYGGEHTIRCLKEHLFNDRLWPDFTNFANEQSPVLEMHVIKAGETAEVKGISITAAPMDHTVECFGYLAGDDGGAVFISGDTCSLDRALSLIRGAPRLKMVVLEASFPHRMEKIANLSRHLTTRQFAREVRKLPAELRVLATHMKPDCLGEIQLEIAGLDLDNVFLLEQGATYDLASLPAPSSKARSHSTGDHS